MFPRSRWSNPRLSRLDMVLVRTSVQWRELSIALMRARAGMVAAMHGPRGSPGPVAVKGLTFHSSTQSAMISRDAH